MSYKFDGVDVAAWGVAPFTDEAGVALEGVFDLPKRTGETEYNWGTEIEAYVEAEDIVTDGRKLTLKMLLKGGDEADYAGKLEGFKRACVELRRLSCEFGEFDVLVKDEVSVEELPGCVAVVSVPMWEQKVTIPELTVSGSGPGGMSVDEFCLEKDFGIVVSDWKGEKDLGKRIEVQTTEPYLRTEFRDRGEVTLSGWMKGESWTELYSRIGQLQALCMKPGLRRLSFPDGTVCEGYVKGGMAVKPGFGCVLSFDLKVRIV